MPRFDEVIEKLTSLTNRVSDVKESELCTILLQAIEANSSEDTQSSLPRVSIGNAQSNTPKGKNDQGIRQPIERQHASPPQATRQAVSSKLSDETLLKMVSSFFHNELYNILREVPDVEDDQVCKHVQEVTMAIHEEAYQHIWELIHSKLGSSQISSMLLIEFLPTITLPATDADCLEAFEHWFRKVHCSAGEPHPPSDVRTLQSTIKSVLRIKEEALKELEMSSENLHQMLYAKFEQKCFDKLKSNKALKTSIQETKLIELASQIVKVVSAMLRHSSPIIPFTKQPKFLAAYHNLTRSAREDPNGRSVLVYRTPYLYFYHYGELKTVLKASVTFLIPPETSAVSSLWPTIQKEDLRKSVKHFFPIEKPNFDFVRASKKTDAFIKWYHSANDILTMKMQHKITPSEYQSLISQNMKQAMLNRSGNTSGFIQAFRNRHRLFAEDPKLVPASSDMHKILTDNIRKENPGKNPEEMKEAARLVIALLYFPEPWIPFGLGDNLGFDAHLHIDVTKDYVPKNIPRGCVNHTKQHPRIQYYLRPLLWSPAANETLLFAKVILQ